MKVLCLGNNTEDTDIRTRALAQAQNLLCHGLLSEINTKLDPMAYYNHGFYHTSVYDISFGRLVELCNKFDQVIMLAQPKEQWSHPDAFYLTKKVLDSVTTQIVFEDLTHQQSITYFEKLVQENKSFCIFPFIELLVEADSTTLCCRSRPPVVKLSDLKDFATDKNYVEIRNKMIAGEMLTDSQCGVCYNLERQGILSARQQETVEWANRLDLSSIEDLKKITNPVYYEIRADNKCNLLCRSCNPENSHLIGKEYKKIGIVTDRQTVKVNNTGFEIVNFENLKKLYIGGGEPMMLTDFYQFIDQCIKLKKTDFEILVNTNGTLLNDKFKQQLKYFSNLQFIFSIDGFKDLNHYIRWPSTWNDIIDNWHYLVEQKHKVTVNTTVSIYNISELDVLFGFIDQTFPSTLIHLNLLIKPKHLSPFLHPNKDKVLKSLHSIKDLDCYKNDKLFSSSIDGYINNFENRSIVDQNMLNNFFDFNDKLDRSRNIFLKDYIPDLDIYRSNSI